MLVNVLGALSGMSVVGLLLASVAVVSTQFDSAHPSGRGTYVWSRPRSWNVMIYQGLRTNVARGTGDLRGLHGYHSIVRPMYVSI